MAKAPVAQAMTKYLIVGSDGLIGSQLERDLSERGEVVVSTTRRLDLPSKVFVDLLTAKTDAASAVKADVAFFCAAMTNIQVCEAEPLISRQINVIETLRLMKRLADEGCFVVFLSSNAVFDGQSPFPDEDATYSPTTEYGRQKVSVEKEIRNSPSLTNRVAIVRLSKVVSSTSGVVAEFLRRLRAADPCHAFDDLLLCPVSLGYVCAALIYVATTQQSGIFHLSGAEEMTYAQFAENLATHVGADPRVIVPGRSNESNLRVLFNPLHPALGMKRTGHSLGIAPQSRTVLMNDLVSR